MMTTRRSKAAAAQAEELLELVCALAAVFNREADEALQLGYVMGLRDVPLDAARRAVERAIRECKFMPSPAELRELVGEIRPDQRAALAWGVANQAVRVIGPYRSVVFDDPVLNATLARLGGWVWFCDIPERELPFKRKEFEQVYTALWNTGVHAEDTRPLTGLFARENSLQGQREDKPALVSCGLPAPRPGLVRPSVKPAKSLPANAAKQIGVMDKALGNEGGVSDAR